MLGDKYNTRWEQEEPGLVTTVMDIPALDDLLVENHTRRQILHVVRQAIYAVD